MKQDITTTILALGPGAMLGLLALGIVLVFRTTGTLNLAHGAMATFGAYAYLQLGERQGLPLLVALLLATVLTGMLGILVQLLVMRPLRDASVLTKLIASTAVLVIVQSALDLRYGSSDAFVPSLLPVSVVHLPGDTYVGVDRILLLVLAVAVAAALWVAYRYTSFGISTSAVAENPVAASALGIRVDRVEIGNWFIAGCLAGFAGALLAPVTGLNLVRLSGLIVPALAAALVGSLTSFPLTLLGGIVISVAQSETTVHSSMQGASTAVPLLAIVVVMFLRGNAIPARGFIGARLPMVGTGKVRVVPTAIAVTLVLLSVFTWLGQEWINALLLSLLIAIILLSVVVITGYAGQVSLAQYSFAGFGAYVASTLSSAHHWPFEVTFVLGVAGAVVLGSLLAIPAARMRGASLAVVTLAFSGTVFATLFNRSEQIVVRPPSLLGFDLDPIFHSDRYLALTLGVLLLLILSVANLRRSPSGRRLIAVRSNERAAASIGINVAAAKSSAFALASGIAAAGGILLAFQSPIVVLAQFDVFGSINMAAWSVIGGVGLLVGPLIGMTFVSGGVGNHLTESIVHANFSVIALIGGVLLVVTLKIHPDGVASLAKDLATKRLRKAAKRGRGSHADAGAEDRPTPTRAAVRVREETRERTSVSLDLTGVSVRFGGVHALTNVDLRVEPGEVHGLIGPNGAGKTTLLDAISGFVRPSSGVIQLGDRVLDGLPTWRRARLGIGRSFQNVQLFADLTVLDNVRAASDVRRRGGFVRDLVWPGEQTLSATANDAIETLALGGILDSNTEELSYGRRQLVAIARALAANPSVVLLDEPAAGLSEL
ncbi:MAG: hypothetical protein JWO68_3199, partial [Actinomycetia bacterium]|nr:hypothetical protein [Actinomycetes bacterium]